MKRHIKHWLGVLLARTGLYRPLLRRRGLVVLFHRVDDRLDGDLLTCTTEAFAAWCRFLRRHFRVVSLSELVGRLERGEDVGLYAAITFDDGYRDNYTLAAAELERQDLPACFFVATEFLESDHVPWWDRDLPVRPRWMTWDQVRDLAKRGFEIGSHTLHHADLGRVDAATAEREIHASRERLAHELGSPVPHFSYPYGGREHFSEACRRRVRQAGYASCSSAYGGLVGTDTDPYRIERMPISPWYQSPYHFLTELVVEVRSAEPETEARDRAA